MALASLASATDLSVRGVDVSEGEVETALAVASAAVRDAAGAPISEFTGTITTPAPSGKVLTLPTVVRDVTSVTVDGTVVTDYEVVGNGLWRRNGWALEPVPVAVTATFGLPTVPADIVDLTCNLAKSWLDHVSAGGGSTAGLTSVALDDAREAYTDEAAGQVSPVFIPKVTRDWLASRFGGSAFVVESW